MPSFSQIHQIIYRLVRVILGALFVIASWDKIIDPEAFAKIIENYKILPPQLVNPTAYILPWIEAVSGILLIFGVYVKGCALIFNSLMVVFIVLLTINQIRGLDVACGCFSLSLETSKSMYYYIVRDIVILSAGLWVLVSKIRYDKAQTL